MPTPDEREKIWNEEMTTQEDAVNEYYDLANAQEYTALMDKEVQLQNAKAAALKSTQAQTAAMGHDASGYGSTLNAQTENQYLNAMQNAQTAYNSQIAQNDMNRRNELLGLQTERFDTSVSTIQNSTSQQRLNEYMSSMGYMDDSGNLVKPSTMSNEDWAQLVNAYNTQSDAIASASEVQNYATFASADELGATTYVDKDGKNQTFADKYGQETQALFSYAARGDFSDGDAIQMRNGSGDTVYLQYTDNGFRMISKSEFDKAESKGYVSWEGNWLGQGKVNYTSPEKATAGTKSAGNAVSQSKALTQAAMQLATGKITQEEYMKLVEEAMNNLKN